MSRIQTVPVKSKAGTDFKTNIYINKTQKTMKITLQNTEISLSAKLIQEGMTQTENPKMKYNQFRVSVKTKDAKTSFLFHGSHNDWQKGKIELSGNDLLFAFYCFMSDSASGDNSFEDFCSEFGYDTDSRKAEKIWKACKKSLDKASLIFEGTNQSNLYDALNEFQEIFPEAC